MPTQIYFRAADPLQRKDFDRYYKAPPPLKLGGLRRDLRVPSSSPRMNVTRLQRLSPTDLDVSCELPEREPSMPHNLRLYES